MAKRAVNPRNEQLDEVDAKKQGLEGDARLFNILANDWPATHDLVLDDSTDPATFEKIINWRDPESGDTVAHKAVLNNDPSALLMLVVHKADMGIFNNRGETPWDLIVLSHNPGSFLELMPEPEAVVAAEPRREVVVEPQRVAEEAPQRVVEEQPQRAKASGLENTIKNNWAMTSQWIKTKPKMTNTLLGWRDSENGNTILHEAVRRQDLDVLPALLALYGATGSSVQEPNKQGMTPYQLADEILLEGTHPNTDFEVQHLLEQYVAHAAPVNEAALHIPPALAVPDLSSNHHRVVSNDDPEGKVSAAEDGSYSPSSSNRPPAVAVPASPSRHHRVVSEGDPEQKELSANKAQEVDYSNNNWSETRAAILEKRMPKESAIKPDANGNTLLHMAVHNQDADAIRILVYHYGANPGSRNKWDQRPLDWLLKIRDENPNFDKKGLMGEMSGMIKETAVHTPIRRQAELDFQAAIIKECEARKVEGKKKETTLYDNKKVKLFADIVRETHQSKPAYKKITQEELEVALHAAGGNFTKQKNRNRNETYQSMVGDEKTLKVIATGLLDRALQKSSGGAARE
jgi:hypothetical protein